MNKIVAPLLIALFMVTGTTLAKYSTRPVTASPDTSMMKSTKGMKMKKSSKSMKMKKSSKSMKMKSMKKDSSMTKGAMTH